MIDETPARPTLVSRAYGLLCSPCAEWAKIAAERTTVSSLYARYICPLALLPVAAWLISQLVFGSEIFGLTLHTPAMVVLATAALGYALDLLGVLLLAGLIAATASAFGARLAYSRALQLAAYSATWRWIAGLLHLAPALSGLAPLGALYGIYLLYLGTPLLAGAAPKRALGLTALAGAASLVLGLGIALTTASLGERLSAAAAGAFGVEARLPDGTTVAVDHVGDASTALKDAARQLKDARGSATGGGGAIAPEALEALLPEQLAGGLAAAPGTSRTRSVGRVETTQVIRVYQGAEGRHVALSITDMARAAPLAALAGGLGIRANRETATGYEKFGKVDGRMVRERFDRVRRSGQYQVLVGDRFMVEVDGAGVDADQLRAAAAAVDFRRLEALAKSG